MTIIKSIETLKYKIWIEQHNDLFVLKHQEGKKEIKALKAMQNLTLILNMFDILVGRNFRSN